MPELTLENYILIAACLLGCVLMCSLPDMMHILLAIHKANAQDELPKGWVTNPKGPHDCDGKPVEHVISYDEFESLWLKDYIRSCHDFTNKGFLFDQGGVYGFDDCVVGFETKTDQERYRQWLVLTGRAE